jgi:hypothetical protein
MRRLLGVPSLAERLQTRTRAAWQKLQSPPKTPHEKVPGVEAQPPPSVTIQPLPIQVEASALPASVDIRTTWMLSILEGQDRTEPRSWPHDDKPLSYEAFLEWLAEQQLESDRDLAQQQRDSDRFLAQQMLEFERGQPGFWMSAKPADQR